MTRFFPNSRYFWGAHITGWLAVTGLPPLLSLMTGSPAVKDLVLSLVVLVTGSLFCLAYRYYYQQYRWGELHVVTLVLRSIIFLLAGVGFILLIMASISEIWAPQLLTGQQLREYQSLTTREHIALLTGNGFVLSVVLALWLVSYVGVSEYRRRQRDAWNKIKLQAALKEAQLNALVNQINPHFLFNGLNNIRSLIRQDADKAMATITSLAEVLRSSLKTQNHTQVPLQQELELVDNFIAIAKLQFEQRLRYTFRVELDCERVRVPPMSVQSLVENALKHGIAPCADGGDLHIHAFAQAQETIIDVWNTGQLYNGHCPTFSTGTGLANLRERLKLIHPRGCALQLEQIGNHVRARIVLISAAPI